MTSGLRLLIVDDERIEREAVRLFASRMETPFAAIEEAENGVDGVLAAREFRPDIIVLDIRMPGKSGVEAAQEIRAADERARIVFLTAFGELDYAKAAFKVRADDFLVKPVAERAFGEAIRRAVQALAEAGAISCGNAAPFNERRRDAEAALIEAIRRGGADAAERAEALAFESADEGESAQESRRTVRTLIELMDRTLRGEFGREFSAGAAALDALSRARDRAEARLCLVQAAGAYASEIEAVKTAPQRRTVEAAIGYIRRRLSDPISLEDVCASVGLSRSHFSRLFHAETGLPFSEYLCAKRIEKAKELLADPSVPIKRVCDSCGFRDQSYFSSVFKKREGINPSEYRTLAERRTRTALLRNGPPD